LNLDIAAPGFGSENRPADVVRQNGTRLFRSARFMKVEDEKGLSSSTLEHEFFI
jgi:hypothetical protein